jgi:hypothetical protein
LVANLPSAHRQLAEWLRRELDTLEPLRQEAEEWLSKESKCHPIIRKLNTAPGMGPIRTPIVVAVVADPHRFRTKHQFWSYCGLGIETRSSSDWVKGRKGDWVWGPTLQTRGLTRKRNALLKAVFNASYPSRFRMTIWNQTIPDALRGRLASIEMVSHSSGPLLGHRPARGEGQRLHETDPKP